MPREYDIVLFGATGDAGRATAQYLARVAPASLKWAVAGRSAEKLDALAASLGEGKKCSILIASCDDTSSMTKMAQSTRLILSAAGPYSMLGEPVLLACLAAGTHYVDITGEVDWVCAMKEKYEKLAVAAGICICNFCGYDCVPAEISVFNAIKQLPSTDSLSKAECVFFTGEGGAPRGTLVTILTKAGQPLSMFSGLIRFVPASARVSTLVSLFLWLMPWWSSHVNAFTVPHFMGWCNTPVVQASCVYQSAKGKGLLQYQDRQLLPFSDRWWSLRGLIPVFCVYAAVFAVAPAMIVILVLPTARSKLIQMLQQSYSYAGSETSQVVVYTRVTGSSGAQSNGTFICPGDPGIHCTALLAAETAMTMVEATQLRSGLTTPAVAVGDALTKRLAAANVRTF